MWSHTKHDGIYCCCTACLRHAVGCPLFSTEQLHFLSWEHNIICKTTFLRSPFPRFRHCGPHHFCIKNTRQGITWPWPSKSSFFVSNVNYLTAKKVRAETTGAVIYFWRKVTFLLFWYISSFWNATEHAQNWWNLIKILLMQDRT